MKQTDLITKAIEIVGGRTALARAINASSGFVYQMRVGMRPVPARFAIPIEKATKGAVKRYEIAPSVFPAPKPKAETA